MSEQKTKAAIKAPVRALESAPVVVADNIVDKSGTMNLNFKVKPPFYKEFKVTAATNGMKMQDLLVDCFEAWKEKHSK